MDLSLPSFSKVCSAEQPWFPEVINGVASPAMQEWPEAHGLQGAVPTSSSAGRICSLSQTWDALQKELSPEQAGAHFRRCNQRACKHLLLSWQLIYSARTKAGVNFHWIQARQCACLGLHTAVLSSGRPWDVCVERWGSIGCKVPALSPELLSGMMGPLMWCNGVCEWCGLLAGQDRPQELVQPWSEMPALPTGGGEQGSSERCTVIMARDSFLELCLDLLGFLQVLDRHCLLLETLLPSSCERIEQTALA